MVLVYVSCPQMFLPTSSVVVCCFLINLSLSSIREIKTFILDMENTWERQDFPVATQLTIISHHIQTSVMIYSRLETIDRDESSAVSRLFSSIKLMMASGKLHVVLGKKKNSGYFTDHHFGFFLVPFPLFQKKQVIIVFLDIGSFMRIGITSYSTNLSINTSNTRSKSCPTAKWTSENLHIKTSPHFSSPKFQLQCYCECMFAIWLFFTANRKDLVLLLYYYFFYKGCWITPSACTCM